ncbi:hypothetical protein [Bradyrhizobium sp. B120]|uniref:hypothetical protein n=1 Tax=Bradyrhizobium sp. B120 TaxID=3410088 RepID=UPI003B980AB5
MANDCDGGAISSAQILEAFPIEDIKQQFGGVAGAAAGEDLDGVEGLEGPERHDDDDEHRHRPKQRQGDGV